MPEWGTLRDLPSPWNSAKFLADCRPGTDGEECARMGGPAVGSDAVDIRGAPPLDKVESVRASVAAHGAAFGGTVWGDLAKCWKLRGPWNRGPGARKAIGRKRRQFPWKKDKAGRPWSRCKTRTRGRRSV